MEIILILIVILIAFVIFLGTIYALWLGWEQWQYMHDPHKMLFLSSTNSEINEKLDQIIAKYLPKTLEYNLVELGCGKAVVLKSLAQKYQWKSVTGIEGQKSVWLQAWVNCQLIPKLKTKLKLPHDKKWELGLVPSVSSPRQEELAAKQNEVSLWSKQKIHLLNQNIFDYKSQKPTFNYCYLGVKLMKELYDKGLFADSIVATLDYGIEGLEPMEIIHLKTRAKIQKELLIYKVN
jgi:hypothetical protein